MGRKLVAAMKDKLGKQLFEVIIQASANGDVVARETIKVTFVVPGIACAIEAWHRDCVHLALSAAAFDELCSIVVSWL